MTSATPTLRRHFGQLRVLGALALASGLCLVLTLLRVLYSHSLDHSFLLFNLTLAWLPVLAALAAYNLRGERTVASRIFLVGCGALWLLFLPNAPYLVTDLVHLHPRPMVPHWYDVLLLATFAWTGLFLGLVSLILMQDVVRRQVGQLTSWLFVVSAIGLAGYGVYLGRFLRWNSWDLLANPWPLAHQAAATLRHPLAHPQATVFSLIFAAVFGAMYMLVVALAHLAREGQERTRPAPP